MSDKRKIVLDFWALMQTNDFAAASQALTQDVEVQWALSNERILGRDNFAKINALYPAIGGWRFSIENIVADDVQVVTNVLVTDGAQIARAISFFKFEGKLISHILEYWPEPYDAPEWRREFVQPLD